MGKSLVDSLLDQIFDAKWVGKRGETLTARELKWVNFLGRKGKIYKNLYVPKEDGETSEIDVVFLCQKGIFVIESKNYSGWIFGAEKDLYWMAQLSAREKNRFYNPIKQNRTHIKWLQSYLARESSAEIPFFSLIVFSERCTLKKIQVDSPDVQLLQRDRLYAAIRTIWDAAPDVLGELELESIGEKLKALTHADKAIKEAHIASIQERFPKTKTAPKAAAPVEEAAKDIPDASELENLPLIEEGPALALIPENLAEEESLSDEPASAPEFPSEPDSEPPSASTPEAAPASQNPAAKTVICPRCGSSLVLRTAKKGPNAGNQFYGCSGFPKCRYTQALE